MKYNKHQTLLQKECTVRRTRPAPRGKYSLYLRKRPQIGYLKLEITIIGTYLYLYVKCYSFSIITQLLK